MKKILALCCLMFASICWGVTGANTTTYSTWPAVADLEGGATNYLATRNAWKAMPTKAIISVSSLGDRIYVLDSSGCVFIYDSDARTYTEKSWGCSWTQVTVDYTQASAYFMIGLLKADAGCPSGTQRFYWSYNEAAPGSTGYCASQWYGSGNHSQLQVNRTGTPSGHTWYYDGTGAGTYHDMGTGWLTGNVSEDSACLLRWDAVTGGNATRVYFVNSSGIATLFSAQPPLFVSKGFTGGFTGCTINSDVVVVTDGTKSYMSDLKVTTPVWKLITGAASKISGDGKGTLLGISSGNLSHLNVYAGYISATLQSTYTGCPDDTHPCPPSGVTHTRSIQVTFPHGVNGNLATFAGAPTATNQVISWDASPQCDPIFGDFHDPECFVATGGGVHCSVVNNSIYQPPPAPTCHDTTCQAPKPQKYSHDARSYDTAIQGYIINFEDGIIAGTYEAIATAKCEADIPACAPGTPPAPLICPATTGVPPGQNPYFTEDAHCEDLAPYSKCSRQIVSDRAIAKCSFYKHGWGFIEFIAGYTLNDPAGPGCYPLPLKKHFAPPVNYPCAESDLP